MEIPQNKSDRRVVVACGKLGVLDFYRAFYESLDFPEEEISEFIERDSLRLQEGCYTIDENGVNYHG